MPSVTARQVTWCKSHQQVRCNQIDKQHCYTTKLAFTGQLHVLVTHSFLVLPRCLSDQLHLISCYAMFMGVRHAVSPCCVIL